MTARRPSLALAAALLLAGCAAPHEWHGSPVDPPAAAPPLTLPGAGGRRFDLAAERGKAVLVFFGYTHCPDVCPTTLADWTKARRALGADTARVRFVFVSVDPERDPPDSAAAYARRFDPTFVGLGGTRAEIEAVTGAWGVAAIPESAPGDAPDPHAGHGAGAATPDSAQAAAMAMLSHTARTFVVDPQGRLRLLFSPETRPADVASDVKALL